MHGCYLIPSAILVVLSLVSLRAAPALGQDQPPQAMLPSGQDQTSQEASGKSAVHLEKSFGIPYGKEAKQDLHTPAALFTADGQHMVTVTSQGEVFKFGSESRDVLRRFKMPTGPAHTISVDSRGQILVAAVNAGLVVFDLTRNRQLTLDRTLKANQIAVAPDSKSVAISRDSTLELRSLPQLKLVFTIRGHQSEIACLAWNSDGRFLGSTATDGRLLVYDVHARKVRYATKKAEPLYALAFEPRNQSIVYGGEDLRVYQYDFETEKESVISNEQPYWITCLGYSPDGKTIAVGDESCDIWLFDEETQELIFHNKHHEECWLSSVSWAADGETFIFACRPNSLANVPAVYAPLAIAEAMQAKDVGQQRIALLQKIDAHLKEVQDDEQRKLLESSRDLLVGQSKPVDYAVKVSEADQALLAGSYGVGAMGGSYGGYGFGGMGGGGFGADMEVDVGYGLMYGGSFSGDQSMASGDLAVPGAVSVVAQLESLSPELREAVQAYKAAVQDEVSRLNKQHRINQWKIRRPSN